MGVASASVTGSVVHPNAIIQTYGSAVQEQEKTTL
jgi:hypothetical protein